VGWGPRGDSGPVRGRVRATQPANFPVACRSVIDRSIAALSLGSHGTLQGTGTIIGNVAMGGTIMPGAPGTPGTITIFGNYEQIGNGTLEELMSPFSKSSQVSA
jgi:hypothetical protein